MVVGAGDMNNTSHVTGELCQICNNVHHPCYPCVQRICVISTPGTGIDESVSLVSAQVGGRYEFDGVLASRQEYLPFNHMFSVKVYTGQYLHVTEFCVQGSCQCIYFLDNIPHVLKPCRFAASMYLSDGYGKNEMFVLSGMCRGFRVVDGTPNISYSASNYKSILQEGMREKMDDTIKKELRSGQISVAKTPPRCTHALGGILRPDGRIRPITDCSKPLISVNDYMSSTAPRFTFASIDCTRDLVTKGSFGAVVDISNAYRNVLIYPPHREYVGITWSSDGITTCYVDNVLCFGLRSAPSIFNSVSEFVTGFMLWAGIQVVGYLDDFFLACPSEEECQFWQEYLIDFLYYLGFKVNFSKVSPPSNSPKYLGILLDLTNMVFCLPEEKLVRAERAVSALMGKKWVSYKALEQVTGYLAHCASIIKSGRTFSRRIYGFLKATKGKRRVRLSENIRLDLQWWSKFLRVFNGCCPIDRNSTPNHEVFTDASDTGFGGWYNGDYFYGFWVDTPDRCKHFESPPKSQDIKGANINVKELWPVMVALKRWGSQWVRDHVLFRSDNTQVLCMLASGRSVNRQAMHMLRELFWHVALNHLTISALHIPTKENNFADLLSRLFPMLSKKSIEIPQSGPKELLSCCCSPTT